MGRRYRRAQMPPWTRRHECRLQDRWLSIRVSFSRSSSAWRSAAEDCGPLHVTRVAPFCQIYAPTNAAAVGSF
ncbi:hypothetical protein PF003_g30747 [Phytophthora fragariae]|nr:hypothetical protein PF003_g30747 [Phytophthora fragariae]